MKGRARSGARRVLHVVHIITATSEIAEASEVAGTELASHLADSTGRARVSSSLDRPRRTCALSLGSRDLATTQSQWAIRRTATSTWQSNGANVSNDIVDT